MAAPPAQGKRALINNAPGFNANIAREDGWWYTSAVQQDDNHTQTTSQHTLLSNTAKPTHHHWEQRCLVDNRDTPITAIYITKKQHAGGIQARPIPEVKRFNMKERKFRDLGWLIVSETKETPLAPDKHTKDKAEQVQTSGLAENATERLLGFLRKAYLDENGDIGHRSRLRLGTPTSELRISPSEYSPIARDLIGSGWTLINRQGRMEILDQTDTHDVTWGFNANAIRTRAKRIGWPDKTLQSSLQFGFEDHSDDTPPMSVASPHQTKALSNKKEFDALICKEIGNGWYTAPSQLPPTLPFRLTPGSLEPKSTIGKFRLIRNSSWPKPGTHNSLITNGSTTLPLATNDCTELPHFMGFEWTSIDSNNSSMLILADLAKRLGTVVNGTTIDFSDWFRQLAIAKRDYWKAAIVTKDGVRIDKRLQMGRRSSALHGQRLSFLIGELVEREAEEHGWVLQDLNDKQRELVREWQAERAHLGPRQQRIFKVGPFQDDHVFLTVTPGQSLLHKCKQFIQNTLEVELSPKPDANKPLSTCFNAIGASYNTGGKLGITVKPKDTIVDKFTTITKEVKDQIGKLVPLQMAQSWMGLAQFIQQFVQDGRFYLNSGYLAIKASAHIHTRTPRVSVGQQWSEDLDRLRERIGTKQGELIPMGQVVWDKGVEGPYVDATAPVSADGRGWGIVMGSTFARGAWSSQVAELCKTGTLNINHLELLAVAIAVDIFGREGLLGPHGHRIVVRGDNIGARDIANKWAAEGTVMCTILRILHNACANRHARIWMVHVSTTDNAVADGLSRSPTYHTTSPRLKGGTELKPPEHLETWLKQITNTARAEPIRAQPSYKEQHPQQEVNDENDYNAINKQLALQ